MTRADVVAELVSRIGRVRCPHPIRAAIDGVDAAGKTTLADELVAPLTRTGRFVILEVTVARAEAGDHHVFGSTEQVRHRYAERYVPGQRLYLAEAQPEQHASVVVENTDAAHPRLGGL